MLSIDLGRVQDIEPQNDICLVSKLYPAWVRALGQTSVFKVNG